MKKIIFLFLGILVLIGICLGGWYYSNFTKYAPTTYVSDTTSGEVTTNTITNTTSTTTPTFTLADVSKHTDITSCYSIINDSVYDLTTWVNMHPGGSKAILSICGVDGTEKFMKKHKGGEKFMTILARFKIGTLTQ